LSSGGAKPPHTTKNMKDKVNNKVDTVLTVKQKKPNLNQKLVCV
jgi:hypothetical protein